MFTINECILVLNLLPFFEYLVVLWISYMTWLTYYYLMILRLLLLLIAVGDLKWTNKPPKVYWEIFGDKGKVVEWRSIVVLWSACGFHRGERVSTLGFGESDNPGVLHRTTSTNWIRIRKCGRKYKIDSFYSKDDFWITVTTGITL